MLYEIIFTYNGKKYKHKENATTEDSARYFFNALCFKKNMDLNKISIISITPIKEKTRCRIF